LRPNSDIDLIFQAAIFLYPKLRALKHAYIGQMEGSQDIYNYNYVQSIYELAIEIGTGDQKQNIRKGKTRRSKLVQTKKQKNKRKDQKKLGTNQEAKNNH
jgi:hypothetical protein